MFSSTSVTSSRIGWEDVVPRPQKEGPNPVVSIMYSTDFRELMDLFRAVLHSGEKSQRVLELTEEILDTNAANYSVWEYRRQTLSAMNANLHQELNFMDTFAEENPKNYQIWYHRRLIVERLGDASRELEFTAAVFEVDAKNYHAWSHRQWALMTFGLWEGELDFIDNLLKDDIRNNSAWNQRWFVVHNMHKDASTSTGEYLLSSSVLLREFEYTMQAIDKVKCNESAWNYLRGLWKKYKDLDVSGEGQECVKFNVIVETKLCQLKHEWPEELDVKDSNSLFLFELLADVLQSGDKREVHKDTIVQLYSSLKDLDTLRHAYWHQRMMNIV